MYNNNTLVVVHTLVQRNTYDGRWPSNGRRVKVCTDEQVKHAQHSLFCRRWRKPVL